MRASSATVPLRVRPLSPRLTPGYVVVASQQLTPNQPPPNPRRAPGCPPYGAHGCTDAVMFHDVRTRLGASSEFLASARMFASGRSRPMDEPMTKPEQWAFQGTSPAGRAPTSKGFHDRVICEKEVLVHEAGMVPENRLSQRDRDMPREFGSVARPAGSDPACGRWGDLGKEEP